MIKKIFRLVKKIVFSFLLIYSYNLIAAPINVVIPMNMITILYTTFLGIPAFLSIIVLLFIF